MTGERKIAIGVLTALLWLISVGVGMVEIAMLRGLVLRLYALVIATWQPWRLDEPESYGAAVTISNISVLILAVALMAFAVASGEYHAKRVGTSRSWRLFGWTFAVEAVIFMIAYFF